MDNSTIQKAIELLKSGKELKALSQIDRFVWANTVEPKFKLGDSVLVDNSSTSHGQVVAREDIDAMSIPEGLKKKAKEQMRPRLYVRASKVIGRIVRIDRLLREKDFFYEIEYTINYESEEEHGKPNTTHKTYAYERQLMAAPPLEANKWSQMGQVYIG